MNMKRILLINYIYAVIFIVGLINVVINYYGGIVQFFGSALPSVSIILTILFFRDEVKISKSLTLTLNILLCAIFLITPIVFALSEGTPQFVSAIPLLFAGLPFFVNVYMLYKDRYKEL